jgi:hypothetical protein
LDLERRLALKKIGALLLALCCVFTFTACGRFKASDSQAPLTTEQKLDQAAETMSELQSLQARMRTDIDLTVAGTAVKASLTMDIDLFTDPLRIKGSQTTQAMGTDQNILFYIVPEGNGLAMYINKDGRWSRETLSQKLADGAGGQYDVQHSIHLTLIGITGAREAGTEQIDGKQTLKIEGALSGEALKQVILSPGLAGLPAEAGAADYAGLLEDLPDIPVTLWLRQDTLHLVKYAMDMTDCANQIYRNQAAAGGQAASLISITVDRMQMEMTCSSFNEAAEFQLPAEAAALS